MSEIQTSNWSETAASNTATPPNGAPEGMAPSTVNDTMREMMAALRRWFGRWHGIDESEALISSGGTSTAITVTYSNAPASLFTGLEVGFKVTTTCGADPTLNVNSLGAKNIQRMVRGGYVNLAAGDIAATQHVKVKYDGTLDKWILLTPFPAGITFRAHKNGTAQSSITSATNVAVTWSTESWDIGAAFASNAWTPPAGKYRIDCQLLYDNTNAVASEMLWIILRKNGSADSRISIPRAGTGNCTVAGSFLVDANGTDAFDIAARKDGAGDGQLSGVATDTWFIGHSIT